MFLTWQPAKKQKNKKQSLSHCVQPFLKIEGGSGEEQVDGIADCAFEKVSGQPETMLQMPYDWFDCAAASEVFPGFAFVVFRSVRWRSFRQHNGCSSNMLSAAKSPVTKRRFRDQASDGLHLRQNLI